LETSQTDRIIYLWEEVTEVSCLKIIKKIRKYRRSGDLPIYLFINSDGGCLDSAMAVIDEFESCKNGGIEICTVVQGCARSAAANILLAGTKGKRFITPNSYVMLHFTSYSLDDDDYDKQIKAVKFMSKHENKQLEMLAKLCGKQLKTFKRSIQNGLWLDADSAVEFGVVDAVWR